MSLMDIVNDGYPPGTIQCEGGRRQERRNHPLNDAYE